MEALNERYYSCFFTGHRIIGDKNLYDRIFETVKDRIRMLTEEKGVDRFICGGAIGFDALAAEAVIEMKKLYPYIRLIIFVPCYRHYDKWNEDQIDQWKKIIKSADDAVYITSGPYYSGCMQKRNKAMADNAHYCVTYCIRRGSGTGSALVYAESKSCEVYNVVDYL